MIRSPKYALCAAAGHEKRHAGMEDISGAVHLFGHCCLVAGKDAFRTQLPHLFAIIDQRHPGKALEPPCRFPVHVQHHGQGEDRATGKPHGFYRGVKLVLIHEAGERLEGAQAQLLQFKILRAGEDEFAHGCPPISLSRQWTAGGP